MAAKTLRLAIGLALLTLSACVAPPQAPPPPAAVSTPPPPRPAPPPPPPPANWRDRPLTSGDWSYHRTATGGEALYGNDPEAPRLALRCVRASGQVLLAWPGVATAALVIRTTETAATRNGQLTTTELQLAFPARDPLLDQMAYSRGRFMLTAGNETLILPSWPEIARVIEDCR